MGQLLVQKWKSVWAHGSTSSTFQSVRVGFLPNIHKLRQLSGSGADMFFFRNWLWMLMLIFFNSKLQSHSPHWRHNWMHVYMCCNESSSSVRHIKRGTTTTKDSHYLQERRLPSTQQSSMSGRGTLYQLDTVTVTSALWSCRPQHKAFIAG